MCTKNMSMYVCEYRNTHMTYNSTVYTSPLIGYNIYII